MENNLIEKLKIAELDPSKVYFLQMCCNRIDAERMQHIQRYLQEKFDAYGVKNVILFTPPDMQVKFTEVEINGN